LFLDGGMAGTGSGEPSENMNCGGRKLELAPQPAELLLLLDRSGSMLENLHERGSGRFVQKWSEVVGALDVVVQTTQAGVAWGLKLFPHPDACAVPEGMTVPVAPHNHAAILHAVRNNPATDGRGSTPTEEAIRKAGAALRVSPSPASQYLLLATDGLPTCHPGGRVPEAARAGAVAAVAELRGAGIPVFVVGIATLGSDAHATLNQMAETGGRARMDPTRYYSVASRGELVSALETITGQIYACTFPLVPAPPVPDNVTVEVDGVRLARDREHRDGWDYGEDHRSLLLHGPACNAVKASGNHRVQILYGCP
jgi:hypothetical protein